ncbi:hypothetical protein NLI96_g3461 [Meripilus lineatus]|uniref:Uncharacterized protein n=1 Tax=Meripilus lineatus TaxID=2056292 RepID=A0AAD5V8Y9_9APHY|nr:hypothetical protein NLI96_g3461 [Physisporinus lineatus]
MSINGFNSGFRDTVNGTAITQLSVLITPELASSTIWFFDYNTCAQGGVGGININENTNETLQGCANNAIRFNGTGFNTTLPSHSVTTSLIPTSTPTANQTNDAQALIFGGMTVLPLILIGLIL